MGGLIRILAILGLYLSALIRLYGTGVLYDRMNVVCVTHRMILSKSPRVSEHILYLEILVIAIPVIVMTGYEFLYFDNVDIVKCHQRPIKVQA